MKFEIYKSNKCGYTFNKNNSSGFLFEVELGQKWYCVVIDSKLGRTVLEYNAEPEEWNYSKMIDEASKGIANEELECKCVCFMFECWVEEYNAGRYAMRSTIIRKTIVTHYDFEKR